MNLKVLWVNETSITNEAIKQIAKYLPLSQIEWLGLSNNRIDDEGINVLTRLFRYERLKITQLPLSGNKNLSMTRKHEFERVFRLSKTAWFYIGIALCSLRDVPRLGKGSRFKGLPVELIRLIMLSLSVI